MPESTIKLGQDVKTKSIHENEFSRRFVGSLIIWRDLSRDAVFSTEIPSKVLVSWLRLRFALKSSIARSMDYFLTIFKGKFKVLWKW